MPELADIYRKATTKLAHRLADLFRRKYDIALFGVFGCGNFGNDATLEACLNGINEASPNTIVLCIAANPSAVARSYAITTRAMLVRRRFGHIVGELMNFLRAWRIALTARRFIVAGTGVLDDQHVSPSELPLDVLRWSLAARLGGAELVFLGVGAGPIEHAWSRRFLKLATSMAHKVSYRDECSKRFMERLGRNVEEDSILPDLAFYLRQSQPLPSRDLRQRRRIAVGVLAQLNWRERPHLYERYEQSMLGLLERLANLGLDAILIGGDEADSDTRHAVLDRAVRQGLPIRAEECHSFHDVLRTVSACDILIASRYHNLVAGVIAGIPAISLGYGPKNQALLERVGVGEWSHNVDTFDVDDVASQVWQALALRTPLYRGQISDFQSRLRDAFSEVTRG